MDNKNSFDQENNSTRYKSFYALGLVLCGLVGGGSLIGALAISRTEEFHTDQLYNGMGSMLLVLGLFFIIGAIISGVAYKRAVDKEKELQKEYGDEYVNEQRAISRLFTKRFITITLTLILVITIPLVLILTIDRPSSDEVEPGHCIICDKKATNTFQGSEYCKEHYDKAVKWSIDNLEDDQVHF